MVSPIHKRKSHDIQIVDDDVSGNNAVVMVKVARLPVLPPNLASLRHVQGFCNPDLHGEAQV